MEHFSWFHLIPGVADGSAFPGIGHDAAHDAYIIPTAWFVCGLLILLALLARRGLDRARRREGLEAFVPDSHLGIRNVMEIFVASISGLVTSILGERDGRTYFPLFGTLFIYILVSNLMGTIPGFLPPTANMSNNFAIAIVVFVVFNGAGLLRNGFDYIKHLMGPIIWLAPLFLVLETISICVRPFSLSLRLAGNLFGDHMVFGIMSNLVPPLVPVPFLGLGMFVSFIQALVFTLLSVIYVALAVVDMKHDH